MGCGSSQVSALTENEINTILTVERVVNSLSIIGSSSIIACWICFPSLRKIAFTLVLYLSISDVLGGIATLMSPGKDGCGAACLFQAYLISIFGLSSVLWTACIGHCLFRAIRHQNVDVEHYQYRYHLFSWGVPFLLALVPQFSNSYGNENGQCWILKEHPTLRFIQFYIPLWAVIAYNASVYLQIIANLKAMLRAAPETSKEDLKIFWRLGLYPAVLVVCWFFGSVNRLHNSFNPSSPSFTLFLLHRLFGGSQGLLNCVVYGLNGVVRSRLRQALCGGGDSDVAMEEGKTEQMQLASMTDDM